MALEQVFLLIEDYRSPKQDGCVLPGLLPGEDRIIGMHLGLVDRSLQCVILLHQMIIEQELRVLTQLDRLQQTAEAEESGCGFTTCEVEYTGVRS